MPVKFGHTSLRFWFFLSYLITTVPKTNHVLKQLRSEKSLWLHRIWALSWILPCELADQKFKKFKKELKCTAVKMTSLNKFVLPLHVGFDWEPPGGAGGNSPCSKLGHSMWQINKLVQKIPNGFKASIWYGSLPLNFLVCQKVLIHCKKEIRKVYKGGRWVFFCRIVNIL